MNEQLIKESLDTRVQFRMTNKLAQALKEEAKKNDVILSIHIRNILSDSLK